MPEPVSDLDVLRVVLGGDRLTADWYDWYGVRKKRSDALTAASNHKSGYSSDSFRNPNSETAMTLFMLGATDGWRQIGRFANRPRIAGESWNEQFFADVASNGVARSGGSASWEQHVGPGLLLDPDTDAEALDRLIVLFEVEVAGHAFRRLVGGRPALSHLSFLDISGLKKWVKFDAVLIDRQNRRLYFIEAKLGSDLSPDTAAYPLVNQAVRGLEAAYWLTKASSGDEEWSFRYVLVCPRVLFVYRLRFYAHAFRSKESVAAMLSDYAGLLGDHHRTDRRDPFKSSEDEFRGAFKDFADVASRSVRVVHWDDFGLVLAGQKDFWPRYFDRVQGVLSQAGPPERAAAAVDAIKRRLTSAGVAFSV